MQAELRWQTRWYTKRKKTAVVHKDFFPLPKLWNIEFIYVHDLTSRVVCLSQNRILWIDEKNLTARVEAGIVGQDLERLVSNAHARWFSFAERTRINVKRCANDQAVWLFPRRLSVLIHLGTPLLSRSNRVQEGVWDRSGALKGRD